jgi:hypothetical protein
MVGTERNVEAQREPQADSEARALLREQLARRGTTEPEPEPGRSR